jgi:pimeloyl-ACP methyl ester carboxylesterase
MTPVARRLLIVLIAGLGLLGLLGAAGAQAFTLNVTGPADAPQMVFGTPPSVSTVCLPVTNPAGGQSVLYGQRFTDGPVTSATPAIILAHGIASNAADWDYSPTWSVARALASAGYVVFSYDRLGYDKSSYFDHPGGGQTLTTAAHRAMLHDVVGDVRTGGYTTTSGADCSGAPGPAGAASQKIVIIGHSGGGWVVAGYPGQYHDVSAMVEADISGSAGGAGASPLGGSSSGGSFTPDPAHPDYFEFFQTTQNCLDFDMYAPGEVGYVAQIACTPPFIDSPFGEIDDLPAMYAQNDTEIAAIGPSIPVLLTSGEDDTTDPPSTAAADLAYYQAHCGCDVTQLLLPDTGHLFQAHRSLSTWVDHVVDWLSAHGVAGTPGPAAPGAPTGPGTPGSPTKPKGPGSGRARCAVATGSLHGRTLGPLALGWTRARARRRLPRFTVPANNVDRFCLTTPGAIRAVYPSAKLLRTLPARRRRRLAKTVILTITANRHYALAGLRPGSRLGTIARRRHLAPPFAIGPNRWYVVPGRLSTGVLKVQGGIVEEVGIAARQLTGGRRAQHRLLHSVAGTA